MTALAILRKDEIIERIAKGEKLASIAPSLDISPQAISKALKSDPAYREAIETGLELRLDAAEQDLVNAEDNVAVTRARAWFQSVAWRAERECPERWGARPTDRGLQISVVLAQQTGNGAVQEQPIAGVVVEAK